MATWSLSSSPIGRKKKDLSRGSNENSRSVSGPVPQQTHPDLPYKVLHRHLQSSSVEKPQKKGVLKMHKINHIFKYVYECVWITSPGSDLPAVGFDRMKDALGDDRLEFRERVRGRTGQQASKASGVSCRLSLRASAISTQISAPDSQPLFSDPATHTTHASLGVQKAFSSLCEGHLGLTSRLPTWWQCHSPSHSAEESGLTLDSSVMLASSPPPSEACSASTPPRSLSLHC